MTGKWLFIGDLQEGVELLNQILTVAKDLGAKPAFIGDYLDSFTSKPGQQVAALDHILSMVEAGEAEALYGNHEASYWHPQMRCSGYNGLTLALLQPHLARMQKLLLSHMWFPDNQVLVTHAGLSRELWEEHELSGETLDDALHTAATRFPHSWLYQIGRSRGGMARTGGPLWCDWNSEFRPVPGLRQVTGHTSWPASRTVRPMHFDEERIGTLRRSPNGDWNIDCLSSDQPAVLLFDPEADTFTPVVL